MKTFALAALLCAALPAQPTIADEAAIERGAYLATIMDCGGCHTPRGPDGAPDGSAHLAGGSAGFEMPGLGIVWPPNITPDAEALGGWSAEEIATALTTGERPDGRILAPVMPWPAYASLSDEDLAALVAYLRAVPAVARATPPIAAGGAQASAPYFTMVMPQ